MSSNVTTSIDQARTDAQALHKKIDANTNKDHAEIRATLENARTEAKKLGATLKSLNQAQLADTRQHIIDAYESIHAFDEATMNLESASYEDLKAKNKVALDHLRAALQSLGRAVAAQRATVSKN